jgi:transposase-like protein
MRQSNKFSPEIRERAVRMVQEHRGQYASLWAAIESIAPKIGCVPQTLLEWVKQAEVDGALEDPRSARNGNPGAGVLVQSPSPVGGHRLHPTRGGGSQLLSSTR